MKISVVVPTYNRKEYLKKCLDSLLLQTRTPDEIIIVVRDDDIESKKIIDPILKSTIIVIRTITQSKHGLIQAYNEGLKNSSGDVVCFIDDDATATSNWIKQIETKFKDSSIGGIGGPCIPNVDGKLLSSKTKSVGKITWFGFVIGNHDKLTDTYVYVDHLRGCNMAFKKRLVNKFNENLKGDGHRFELDACLSIRKQGYKILYDPDIQVYHYIAPRLEEERCWTYQSRYVGNYNNTYVLLNNLSIPRKIIFLAFTFIIEFLAVTRAIINNKNIFLGKLIFPGLHGKLDGLLFYLKTKGDKSYIN